MGFDQVRVVDPNWKKVRQQHDKRKLAAQEKRTCFWGTKEDHVLLVQAAPFLEIFWVLRER